VESSTKMIVTRCLDPSLSPSPAFNLYCFLLLSPIVGSVQLCIRGAIWGEAVLAADGFTHYKR